MWNQPLQYFIFPPHQAFEPSRGFASGTVYLPWANSSCRSLSLSYCVPTSLLSSDGSTGISTCYPSPTPFGLGLGPDLPWVDEPSPGNLGLSTVKILTLLSLLIPAFSLLSRPHILPVVLLPTTVCSPTICYKSTASVYSLAPLNLRRRPTRLVSCYALFE